MDDARAAAIEAMCAALETMSWASGAGVRTVEVLVDAIPRSVLAELAIERGGLEQVGWQRPPMHDETIHRLPRTADEAESWGERPVYRLTAPATDTQAPTLAEIVDWLRHDYVPGPEDRCNITTCRQPAAHPTHTESAGEQTPEGGAP